MISHTGTGDLSTSLAMSHHGEGHICRIGSRPAEEFARPTFAAGAMVWHRGKDGIRIAVIHRPRYDDWSLPKGKVDPGENLAGTAIREIGEETGITARLGWLLGYVHYPVGSRTKVVYYWTAESLEENFEPNEESDELRWVTFEEAKGLLSYEIDLDVVAAGEAMVNLGVNRRVLYVRHAKAHAREGWAGNDDLRPLAKKGRRQSEMLITQLSGYRPEVLFSAAPERCVDTLTPLSQDLTLQIQVDAELGDHGWEQGEDVAMNAFRRVAFDRDGVSDNGGEAPVKVICGQGAVIPGVLARLAAEADIEIDDMRVKKSSAWVLHFRDDKLLGIDYLASPLPVK
ncbi:NUDIX hydrolase [Corynebacterium auriscanis]|uniref:NUDIX hydrolase n=1 Tax=Corynebacterium auriscanis TaxID=99807 RepID=UPI0022478912|nr:bifunctional NUDIX hydrolase/histidine phosphatase family protein [Corynebacterium auriscanis]MCX2164093.1 NUDIX hydrolase [Corynebacterium auriscanis]